MKRSFLVEYMLFDLCWIIEDMTIPKIVELWYDSKVIMGHDPEKIFVDAIRNSYPNELEHMVDGEIISAISDAIRIAGKHTLI